MHKQKKELIKLKIQVQAKDHGHPYYGFSFVNFPMLPGQLLNLTTTICLFSTFHAQYAVKVMKNLRLKVIAFNDFPLLIALKRFRTKPD